MHSFSIHMPLSDGLGLTMEEKRHGLINEKMSERTPLIQHVPVAEQQERYPHQRVSAIAIQ